jgi:hypothetical protein
MSMERDRELREWAENFLFPKVHPVDYAEWMKERVATLTEKLLAAAPAPTPAPPRSEYVSRSFCADKVMAAAIKGYKEGRKSSELANRPGSEERTAGGVPFGDTPLCSTCGRPKPVIVATTVLDVCSECFQAYEPVAPEREPQVCDAEGLAEVYWHGRKPPMPLREWAIERLENTKRIAAQKTSPDREGWQEDGWYWEQIVRALAAAPRAAGQAGRGMKRQQSKGIICQSCGRRISKKRWFNHAQFCSRKRREPQGKEGAGNDNTFGLK